MLFALITLACLSASSAQLISGKGPCSGHQFGALISDPTDCSYFYQCISATEARKPCHRGLHFNAKKKECDWPANANCEQGSGTTKPPATTESPTTAQPPTITAPCKSLEKEIYWDSKDCKQYKHCCSGHPFIVRCETGEYFSELAQTCIKAAKCPQDGGGTNPPTTPEPETTVDPEKPITKPCSSYANEIIGDPKDCRGYFYCYLGCPYVVKCESGKYFSEKAGGCIVAKQCPP